MSAGHTAEPPPPSRSGRLLGLVRKLIDYGRHLAATLRQRTQADDTADLARTFGTADLVLILARIAQGLHRALLLEDRIARTAARLDATSRPAAKPSSHASPALPGEAQPPAKPRARPEPQPTDTASPLAALPTPEQIAAKVRRQPIGAVLADICRDLGITRGHPLWDELHLAINDYGGNFIRLAMERLNQAYPIAHIVARLLAKPAVQPEPASTGPPLAVPA